MGLILGGSVQKLSHFWQRPAGEAWRPLAADDYHSQIGSANLDARSLRLNFELNMDAFDPAFHTKAAPVSMQKADNA